VGACIDITDRIESQERCNHLARMVENAYDAIYGKTLQGFITSWNSGAEKMYGYTAEEALGRHITIIIPPDRWQENDYIISQATQGKSVEQFETIRVRKDGQKIHASLTLSPIRDLNRKIIGVSGIARNITAQKEAERKLKELNETLEQRIEERTSSLVHYQKQLRNLAARLTLLEQNERRRIAVELHDYLAQLLVVTRMKTGMLKKHPHTEPVSKLIHEIDQLHEQSLKYTRTLIAELSPTILFDSGLLAAIHWLAEQMRQQHNLQVRIYQEPEDLSMETEKAILIFQTIRELMMNVVKHAQTNQARILITCPLEDTLQITVSDQGVGFDPASHNKETEEAGHFGLFSVGERLESIGGICDIFSAPGQGTQVSITVQISPQDKALPFFPKSTVSNVSSSAALLPVNSNGIRVLIADDHEMVREGIRRIIESDTDFLVIGEAENGREAIELSHTLNPDIVIMDMNMPIMNGIDATRQLREEIPAIKIIGLSVHDDLEIATAMRNAGAVSYLTKGCPAEELLQTLHSFMQGQAHPANTRHANYSRRA
jgi:PAS domain S-box-containing protein